MTAFAPTSAAKGAQLRCAPCDHLATRRVASCAGHACARCARRSNTSGLPRPPDRPRSVATIGKGHGASGAPNLSHRKSQSIGNVGITRRPNRLARAPYVRDTRDAPGRGTGIDCSSQGATGGGNTMVVDRRAFAALVGPDEATLKASPRDYRARARVLTTRQRAMAPLSAPAAPDVWFSTRLPRTPSIPRPWRGEGTRGPEAHRRMRRDAAGAAIALCSDECNHRFPRQSRSRGAASMSGNGNRRNRGRRGNACLTPIWHQWPTTHG